MKSILDLLNEADFSYPQEEMPLPPSLPEERVPPWKPDAPQPPWAPPFDGSYAGEMAGAQDRRPLTPAQGGEQAIASPTRKPLVKQDAPLSAESQYFPSLDVDTLGSAQQYDADARFRRSLESAVDDMVGAFSGKRPTARAHGPSAVAEVTGEVNRRQASNLARLKALQEAAQIASNDARTKAYVAATELNSQTNLTEAQSRERVARMQIEKADRQAELDKTLDPLKAKKLQAEINALNAGIGKTKADTVKTTTETGELGRPKLRGLPAEKIAQWSALPGIKKNADAALADFDKYKQEGLAGRGEAALAKAGFQNEAALFRARVYPIITSVGKFIAGGVLSDTEQAAAEKMMPIAGMDPAEATQAVRQTIEFLQNVAASEIGGFKAAKYDIPQELEEYVLGTAKTVAPAPKELAPGMVRFKNATTGETVTMPKDKADKFVKLKAGEIVP